MLYLSLKQRLTPLFRATLAAPVPEAVSPVLGWALVALGAYACAGELADTWVATAQTLDSLGAGAHQLLSSLVDPEFWRSLVMPNGWSSLGPQ